VHGRAPLQLDRAILPEHFQTLEIYVRPGSIASDKMPQVTYEGIDGVSEAGLSISLPAKADVKILVDNLAYATACASPRSADQVIEEDVYHRGINVSVEIAFDAGRDPPLYLVAPKASDYDFYVHCLVRPVTEAVTYNKREASFSTFSVVSTFPNDKTKPALAGYEPAASFLMRFDLNGAEDVGFSAGYGDRRLSDYEQARIIPHGAVVTVHWINLYSEQMRDVILIVIGSLIAIGVTMLIEAVRPLVERLGERKPATQAHAAATAEPAGKAD
jgi:hypothetical protein